MEWQDLLKIVEIVWVIIFIICLIFQWLDKKSMAILAGFILMAAIVLHWPHLFGAILAILIIRMIVQ